MGFGVCGGLPAVIVRQRCKGAVIPFQPGIFLQQRLTTGVDAIIQRPQIQLFQRVFPAINSIAKQNDGKNVAIFTHATVIRVFFNYAYGNKIEGMKNLPWATNCSVSSVKYDNGKFSVIEYSRDDFLGDSKTYLPPNV